MPRIINLGLRATMGANLKRLRAARGYSQAHLAKLLGVQPLMVVRYEQGSEAITVARLWEMAKILTDKPVKGISEFFKTMDKEEL